MPPSRKRRNVPARQSFDTELSRGYSAALMETRAYWKSITACSAHFEVPEKEVDTMRDLVREHMQNVYPFKVPLMVDIGVGQNWRDLE